MTGPRISEMTLPGYMCDVRGGLRPSSFMELCQEIATWDAVDHGFDDPHLMAAHNSVWVLARMKVVFRKRPERFREFSLKTWHKGLSSIFFVRDYQMADASGEVLVDSTSSWVIMDVGSRRAVRPAAVSDIIPPEPLWDGNALVDNAAKVVIPKGLETREAGAHRIAYSDVDPNRHANNTRYVSWAMDCLPAEITFGKDLRELEINFNREAVPGEDVALIHACDGGDHYVEGLAPDGSQVFICKLSF